MPNRIKLPLIFILSTVCLFVISCNDRTKTPKSGVEITLDIMLAKDETLQLFYKINTDDGYTESLSIEKPVIGSRDFQKVHFALPVGIKPKNIRIDFGDQPGLDSLRLREITISYKRLKLKGDINKIQSWFDFNQNIHYNSTNDYFYLEQALDGLYDPQITGNSTLNKRIVKLFIPDPNDTL